MKSPTKLFTDKEYSDGLSFERLLEILRKRNVKIWTFDQDWNAYGEFCFLNIQYKDEYWYLWGLGIHESRGTIKRKLDIERGQGVSWGIENRPQRYYVHNKKEVIETLQEVYNSLPKEIQQSREQRLFSLVADLTDDDAAQIELEDNDFGWFE